MTDREFADWLGSLPREVPVEEVNRREHLHDVERGPYTPHGEAVHHTYGESRH